MHHPLPRWIDIGLMPLINLLQALIAAAIVMWIIGAPPGQALAIIARSAFSNGSSLGYTLFYTTDFLFAGLAVALAFHAGLFNIGVEGQAIVAGIGLCLFMLAGDPFLPASLAIILGIIGAAVGGGLWGFIAGWLQARRGCHVVITTIMFNFIAATLLVYLCAHVLLPQGVMTPSSRSFATGLSSMHSLASSLGVTLTPTPLNVSLFIACAALLIFWIGVWHTRWGYALRTIGAAPGAAHYAGIRGGRTIMIAMALSGVLAGGIALNQLLGYQQRLVINFVGGAGFTGIAVALIGRSHPVGILCAALLFGVLFEGGAELSFTFPVVTKDTVVAIQGLIILISGALAYMNRPWIAAIYRRCLYKPPPKLDKPQPKLAS